MQTMKKLALFVFCLVAQVLVMAQEPEKGKIETDQGPLDVQPVYHGAMVLTWNGVTIYVDPYHGKDGYKGMADPDIVLITDIHPDHLDMETLSKINMAKASIVVPKAVYEQLPEELKKIAIVLANDKMTNLRGVNITAIPMYNLPEEPQSMHTKGRGNGYLLKAGGKTVYISGDTEDIPEMRNLKNIDLAFVCMNMPYTMEPSQAADAVLAFKPKVVYPYHYRGQKGMSDVEDFKNRVEAGKAGIEVRLVNWYHEP